MIILCETRDILIDAHVTCRKAAICTNSAMLKEGIESAIDLFEDSLGRLWDLREELGYVEKDEKH